MRLIGRERLSYLEGSGDQVEKWMMSWIAEVMAAHWKHPSDVCNQFPTAYHQGEGRFMFPLRNCNYVIYLLIAFPQGVVLITDLKVKNETHGT